MSTHLWWVHVGMSGYLHLYDVSKSTLTSLTSWDLLVRGCIIFNMVTASFESLPLSVGDVGVEVSLLVTKSVSSSAPSLRNPVAVSRSLNLACLQSRHCAAGPMFPNSDFFHPLTSSRLSTHNVFGNASIISQLIVCLQRTGRRRRGRTRDPSCW